MDGEAIIIRLRDLPDGFDALRHQSEASGYRFLRRAADEWESGANRFDRDGEALLAAEMGGRLVGVCGLSIDPYLDDPRIGRVRNVYVLAEYRGRGIGGVSYGKPSIWHVATSTCSDSGERRRGRPGSTNHSDSVPARGSRIALTRWIWTDQCRDYQGSKGGCAMPDRTIAELIDDLERGYDGDAWHGPPLRKVLDGVSHEVASARPISGGHSIWEIVVHLSAWDDVIVHRIQDRTAIENPNGGNLPPVGDPGPDSWDRALAQLEINHEHLLEAVSELEPSRLDEQVVGKGYDVAHDTRRRPAHGLPRRPDRPDPEAGGGAIRPPGYRIKPWRRPSSSSGRRWA